MNSIDLIAHIKEEAILDYILEQKKNDVLILEDLIRSLVKSYKSSNNLDFDNVEFRYELDKGRSMLDLSKRADIEEKGERLENVVQDKRGKLGGLPSKREPLLKFRGTLTDGIKVANIYNISEFSRSQNLGMYAAGALGKVLRGELRSYKGWRLFEE